MSEFDNMNDMSRRCPKCGATSGDDLKIDQNYNTIEDKRYLETELLCDNCGWRSEIIARELIK